MFTGRLARAFGLFCLLLTAALVWFYYPWLSGEQAFYQSDLTYYFEPFARFICNAFREGRLPLWNPYLYCGMAQVAVPSPGIFYPPILFFMLPFSQGLAAFLVFHQLVAGAGAFLLVASLGWGLLAALVAGIGVGLCGYMFAVQANFTLVATIAWLPLLLFALHKIDPCKCRGGTPGGAVQRSCSRLYAALHASLGWMFLTCVSMALMVGAGRPELSVPAALIAGLFSLGAHTSRVLLCRGAQATSLHPTGVADDGCSGARAPRPHAALHGIALRLASMFLGVLLAMPVLFPALQWATVSPRAHGLDLKWVLMWSANWYDSLCLICSQPVGDLTRLGNPYLNMVASRKDSIPYLATSYVGPIVFTLAIWSLFRRGDRWCWAVLAVGIAMLIMSFGNNTPIASVICSISPAFAAFRYPVKLMIFPALALVMLSSSGACLTATRTVPRSAQIATLAIWLCLWTLGALFSWGPSLANFTALLPWNHGIHINLELMHKAQIVFGESLLVAAGIGLATNALYFLYVVNKISHGQFGALLVAALVGNLLWPAWTFARHGTVPDFYDRPSPLAPKVLDKLATQLYRRAEARPAEPTQKIFHRALTLYFDPLTPGPFFTAGQKLDFQRGFYLYARFLMLPNNNVDYGVPYAFGYEAAEVGHYKTWFSDALGKSTQNRSGNPKVRSDAPIARFCRYTSVGLILTQQFRHERTNLVPKMNPRFFDLVSDDADMNVRMYVPKNLLPRAYFAQLIKKADWNAFHRFMLEEQPTGASDLTYVEDDLPLRPSPVPAGVSPLSADISFVTDEHDHVVLKTTRSSPGLFVLTDQFYPGWIATMDGAPTEIYRVNHFARGIVVPAGTHTINFQYSPATVTAGLACSAFVLLLFLLAFVIAVMKPGVDSPSRNKHLPKIVVTGE